MTDVDENLDDDGFGEWEEHAYFTGCTCDHEEDEHGWGSCNVDDCPCEGGWEE